MIETPGSVFEHSCLRVLFIVSNFDIRIPDFLQLSLEACPLERLLLKFLMPDSASSY